MQTIRHRGRHAFDSISAKVAWGALSGLAQNQHGNHFYVNRYTGSDSYPGNTPGAPFKTLQTAIDACTDWNGDIIHVARGTLVVTTPVLFNKRGIVVLADSLGNPTAMGEAHAIYSAQTDGPAAQVLEPCIIIGMGFCGSQAAGASLEITCEGKPSWPGSFSLLSHCRFLHWGIAKAHALIVEGTGSNAIEYCEFDGLWTGYTKSAIYLKTITEAPEAKQAVYNLRLYRNIFYNIGSGKYCLQLHDNDCMKQALIQQNVNIGSAKFFNADSKTGCSGLFAQNVLSTATDTASYNDTVTNLKSAGFSFAGNVYSE